MKPSTPADPFCWVVMPVIDCLDFTMCALDDLFDQEDLPHPVRVLLVDNGSTLETRRVLEARQLEEKRRLLCWWHTFPLGGPPQGTVNAAWNAGLRFCWSVGAGEVLVVNNDVRLHPKTLACLRAALAATKALFVSAVGVTADDFAKAQHPERGAGVYEPDVWARAFGVGPQPSLGGPDFSCFLISRECHEQFSFDEQFTYFGDNDYHRRLRLAGEGERIFSINLPYLHFGSRTVNRSEQAQAAHHPVFELHRQRYLAKWGGMPHQETYETPYASNCGAEKTGSLEWISKP